MKDFTKADLKNRMVVENRDGKRFMVVDNWLVGYDYCSELSNYRENLKHVTFDEFNIEKIYQKERTFDKVKNIEVYGNPIWERHEIKEVTMAEVEEKFGCKVKIVKE